MSNIVPSTRRSSTVFGIAVSELFILLLFLVILLWIASTPTKLDRADLPISSLEARIKELEREVRTLRSANDQLKQDLELRDRLIGMLSKAYVKKPFTLQPDPYVQREKIREMIAQMEQREELGARGHANCLGKNAGALFRLTLSDREISVQSTGVARDDKVSQIPAALELLNLKAVSIQRFNDLCYEIWKWSDAQKPACRFDVTFIDKTTTKDSYRAAEKAMDRCFYKREISG